MIRDIHTLNHNILPFPINSCFYVVFQQWMFQADFFLNGGQSFGLLILPDTNNKVPRLKYVCISNGFCNILVVCAVLNGTNRVC